jgi:ketosteroid isomerase-like protein
MLDGSATHGVAVNSIRALPVLFLIVCVGVANAESLSERLKRQTQEFSDAGHEGNKAVLERYLDERVIFVNETGEIATKKDIVAGAQAPPPGVSINLKVTEWQMQRQGDVAVATFVDALTENYHGQNIKFDYRSIEVWQRRGAEWKMISSETLTVPHDPQAVSLPAKELEEYAGTYTVAADVTVVVTVKDGELYSAANGGTPSEMKAELRDVFFTPGRAGRKIFLRDAAGHVTGYLSRVEGRDIEVTKVSSSLS